MISYEELCEALERFKRRQNNQAEMDQLNSAPAAETFSLRPQAGEEGFAATPPEDTHEIDVDQMVEDR